MENNDDDIKPIDMSPAPSESSAEPEGANPAPPLPPTEPEISNPAPPPPPAPAPEPEPKPEATASGENAMPEPPPHLAGAGSRHEPNYINKGDYIDLFENHPGLVRINIGVGWEHKALQEDKLDLDICCFLLNKDETTRENEDFIFYNNMSACNGAVKLQEDNRTGAGEGDDEIIFLDLNGIPFDILKIVFVIAIYDPELKGHAFSQVRDVYFRIFSDDDEEELVRYQVNEEAIANEKAFVVANLLREGPKWFIEPQDKAIEGGLAEIAEQYDLVIAERTG